MTLEPKKRAEILKAIKKLVLAHHINVGGVDYAAWTGASMSELRNCSTQT